MTAPYIIVVRGPHGSAIYRGKDIRKVVHRVRQRFAPPPGLEWTEEMEAYIRKNYRLRSTSMIAADLSETTGKKITKNMIIRRWHKMKGKAK